MRHAKRRPHRGAIARHARTAGFTTKAQGLGVGLTLVRRIMRRFGGAIGIESSAGRGTVITLSLPMANPT
jgi:signal transduction histidine kinase